MPPWLLGWAGAAVLCGSLFALGTHWPHPRLNGVHNRSVMRVAPALTPALGILGIAAFGALVTWGLTAEAGAGPSALHVWSAAALLSALVGDLTRPVNPWLATAHVAEAVLTSRHPTRHIPACPARLGRWPAAAGLLAFGAVDSPLPVTSNRVQRRSSCSATPQSKAAQAFATAPTSGQIEATDSD